MRVSDRQILIMFTILKESLKLPNNYNLYFSIPQKDREQLVNAIILQQNDKLMNFD